MGKNNRIKLEFDAATWVIGIASGERVWKVCWEVNRILGLHLASQQEVTRLPGQEIYTDAETEPGIEYSLLENLEKSAKIPKMAQQFRFWLVIKPLGQQIPDLDSIIKKLKTSESISMVMDLTPFNQDKQFLL